MDLVHVLVGGSGPTVDILGSGTGHTVETVKTTKLTNFEHHFSLILL